MQMGSQRLAHERNEVEMTTGGWGFKRLASLGVVVLALVLAACSDEPPPPPPQPIAFSHQAHSEADPPVDCVRCHQGVETQKQAGLPAMATCATCHRRQATDHPEVIKLMEQYANGQGEPIVWRKVNAMPASAMVHYKHKPHIRAEVDCATCHGDVSQMTVAQQVINTADMGWCVDCHRQENASIDCMTCHH
jgi:hypothetical protein